MRHPSKSEKLPCVILQFIVFLQDAGYQDWDVMPVSARIIGVRGEASVVSGSVSRCSKDNMCTPRITVMCCSVCEKRCLKLHRWSSRRIYHAVCSRKLLFTSSPRGSPPNTVNSLLLCVQYLAYLFCWCTLRRMFRVHFPCVP